MNSGPVRPSFQRYLQSNLQGSCWHHIELLERTKFHNLKASLHSVILLSIMSSHSKAWSLIVVLAVAALVPRGAFA
ncbi:hypothetical protein BDR03DRAFT_945218 [Suillus americanus]|nr:hypothetical protein BDR03DRAFT_945218 [Suillus americanus]